jgi:hypothetical protein
MTSALFCFIWQSKTILARFCEAGRAAQKMATQRQHGFPARKTYGLKIRWALKSPCRFESGHRHFQLRIAGKQIDTIN